MTLSLATGLAANLLVVMLNVDFNPVPDFTIVEQLLFVVIWASLCEEMLCRGLLQTLFARVTRRQVMLAAAFFAAMHLPLLAMGAPPVAMAILLPAAFALGWIAGTAREKSGSLLPAVIVTRCLM